MLPWKSAGDFIGSFAVFGYQKNPDDRHKLIVDDFAANYTGVLEQGKVTTPSYKVKRLVNKPREEWAVVEGCLKKFDV